MPDEPLDADQALALLRAAPETSSNYRRFADAIAPQDPERAELIRLAMEEERGLDVGLGGCQDALPGQARQRSEDLQQALRARLPPSLRSIATIAHGFVDGIRVESEPFVRDYAEIQAAFPKLVERGLSLYGLENLAIRHLSDDAAEILAGLPLLADVRRLDLGKGVSVFAIRAIANSPHVGALKILMARPVDGDRCAAVLAEGTGIRKLDRLHLGHCHLGDEGARIIARWSPAASLSVLDLYTNRIGPAGAAHLATLPKIKELDLSHNPLGDKGGEAIFAGAIGQTLREAYLGFTDVGLRTLVSLASAPCASRLRHLDLAANPIGPAMRQCPPKVLDRLRLDRLVALDVSNAQIDFPALQAVLKWFGPIAGPPDARPLRVLDLSGNRLQDIDAFLLATRVWLTPEMLDVSFNEIGPRGREALSLRFGNAVELDAPVPALPPGVVLGPPPPLLFPTPPPAKGRRMRRPPLRPRR